MDTYPQKIYQNSSDKELYLLKYVRLVWERKYWILLITASVLGIWVLFYSYFIGDTIEKYTTSAVVRFTESRRSNLGPGTEIDQMSSVSKVAVLTSNLFLEKPVDSLKLNIVLTTAGVKRSRLFHSIEILQDFQTGQYTMVRDLNRLTFFYFDVSKNVRDVLLDNCTMVSKPYCVLRGNGLQLILESEVFDDHPEVDFHCVSTREAIEMLKKNLETKLDRTHTLLTIEYSHGDPDFSALVTNTIARLFIDQLLEYKKYQTTSVIQSYEEQLNVAQREFEEAEKDLREFREDNPYVFLEDDGQRVVSEISQVETELENTRKDVQDLSSLLKKISQVDDLESRLHQFQELLILLRSQHVVGVLTLIDQYEPLIREIQRLEAETFSPEHPQVMNIKDRLRKLQSQVNVLANNHLSALRGRQFQLGQEMQEVQLDLRKMPQNQLRLAELERNRRIKENIISTIITRYNEAKVADAAITPDAFIIDEALPPLVGNNTLGKLINKAKIYLIGILLGLGLGIGLFIALDYFNTTVKSTEDIELRLRLPVLSAIPVIDVDRTGFKKNNPGSKSDLKLITSDFSPHMAGEAFRLLRTKLFMTNRSESRSFIVGSLIPEDGKSIVSANLAITLAQMKMLTLLVDCDLRRGDLDKYFGCKRDPGLTDLLADTDPQNVRKDSFYYQQTHVPNLFLLPGGSHVPNPSEVLGGRRMQDLYLALKEEFNYIVFDTPPFELLPDAFALNNLIHNIILVVRYGKTDLRKLESKMSEFAGIKNDFIGVVINASNKIFLQKYGSCSYYRY
jgi:tyrosine-protein kinase Etk/Wzc